MVMLLSAPRPEKPTTALAPRRTTRFPLLVAVVFTAAYTLFALGRHAELRTNGFDLGIFVQAVRSYAEGRLPVSDIRDPNLILFGDHFSPILALIAPVFRMFPAAETLLVIQALLFGLSVFTVTRVAERLLNPVAGAVIGISYGLSWGLQTALAFDFHEIAFAVPLIALALDAYLSGRYRRAVAWAAPLVLVKEDLGLTVAVLGLLVAAKPGHRRFGLVTAAAGLVVALVTVLVLIPHFSVDGAYRYLGAGGLAPTSEAHRGELLDLGKLRLVVLLLAPTLFLALRSPLVLLALPTLAWRLVGTNHAYWLPHFHYDAVLMPILFLALIDAAVRLRPAVRRWRQRRGLSHRPLTAVAAAALLTTAVAVATQFPLREVLTPGLGAQTADTASAHRLMDRIPDGASVSTENHLMPQLAARKQVSPIESEHRPEWTLADESRQQELAAEISSARSIQHDGRLILIEHHR